MDSKFKKKLKEALKRRTVSEVSNSFGISDTTLRRWRRGAQKPSSMMQMAFVKWWNKEVR